MRIFISLAVMFAIVASCTPPSSPTNDGGDGSAAAVDAGSDAK